jgi:hypothetical protein
MVEDSKTYLQYPEDIPVCVMTNAFYRVIYFPRNK